MTNLLKRTLIGAVLTVAPVLPAMLGSPAVAHDTRVSVSFASPTAVFGFSYGNPTLYGHVHYGPVPCEAGPLYWYPSHRVYGHYHPRLHYTYYARPVYYPVKYRPAYHDGPPGHAKWKKHHGGKHKHHGRGHHHDDDDN